MEDEPFFRPQNIYAAQGAQLKDQELVKWLEKKIADMEGWCGRPCSSLVSQEMLEELMTCFQAVDPQSKLKLVLSFLYINPRNLRRWRESLNQLLGVARRDPDDWVEIVSELFRDIPNMGMAHAMPEAENQYYNKTVEDMLIMMNENEKLGVLKMNPRSFDTCTASVQKATFGNPLDMGTHFTMKKKPKSYFYLKEMEKQCEIATNLKKEKSQGIISSLPIKMRSTRREGNNALPMKGIPTANTVKMSGGFTNEPKKFQRQLSKREGGAKLIDICEIPPTIKKRRQTELEEDKKKKQEEKELAKKKAQEEKKAKEEARKAELAQEAAKRLIESRKAKEIAEKEESQNETAKVTVQSIDTTPLKSPEKFSSTKKPAGATYERLTSPSQLRSPSPMRGETPPPELTPNRPPTKSKPVPKTTPKSQARVIMLAHPPSQPVNKKASSTNQPSTKAHVVTAPDNQKQHRSDNPALQSPPMRQKMKQPQQTDQEELPQHHQRLQTGHQNLQSQPMSLPHNQHQTGGLSQLSMGGPPPNVQSPPQTRILSSQMMHNQQQLQQHQLVHSQQQQQQYQRGGPVQLSGHPQTQNCQGGPFSQIQHQTVQNTNHQTAHPQMQQQQQGGPAQNQHQSSIALNYQSARPAQVQLQGSTSHIIAQGGSLPQNLSQCGPAPNMQSPPQTRLMSPQMMHTPQLIHPQQHNQAQIHHQQQPQIQVQLQNQMQNQMQQIPQNMQLHQQQQQQQQHYQQQGQVQMRQQAQPVIVIQKQSNQQPATVTNTSINSFVPTSFVLPDGQSPEEALRKHHEATIVKQCEDMLRTANALEPNGREMVMMFMRGNKQNPRPEMGRVVTLKLSETLEDGMAEGQMRKMKVETFFQMDYGTGEWKRLRKCRILDPQEIESVMQEQRNRQWPAGQYGQESFPQY